MEAIMRMIVNVVTIMLVTTGTSNSFEFENGKNVHAFYYLWYGNEVIDGQYYHWNHEILPHWTSSVNERYPEIGQRFKPPDHLHSPFYPSRGPYSSRDPNVILNHFSDLRQSNIGVIVLSWWGQESRVESTDTQGVSTDGAFSLILALAEAAGDIKIAFHLEPYKGRTAQSVREDLTYIHARYGNYTSLLRTAEGRLVMYIYDSYHIPSEDWQKVLIPGGNSSFLAALNL